MKDSRDGIPCEDQFGEWLRISLPGRERVRDKTDSWLRKKSEIKSDLGHNIISQEGHKVAGMVIKELEQVETKTMGVQSQWREYEI